MQSSSRPFADLRSSALRLGVLAERCISKLLPPGSDLGAMLAAGDRPVAFGNLFSRGRLCCRPAALGAIFGLVVKYILQRQSQSIAYFSG